MEVVSIWEWLNNNTDKAKRLYTVLETDSLFVIADKFEQTGCTTCEDAYFSIVSARKQISAEDQQHRVAVNKLLSVNPIVLYHGNKDKTMVPTFGKGKGDSDFGQGFYTTPNKDLGCEWAYSSYTSGTVGYLHTYNLDIEGLNVFDFTQEDSLCWVAEILSHRKLKTDLLGDQVEIVTDRLNEFVPLYKCDTSTADVIIGYRADDSYFKYAADFMRGVLYRETLDKALYLGDLGLQVFVKSPTAFDHLKLLSVVEVDRKYEEFYRRRDTNARSAYEQVKKRKGKTTILDYIR